MNNFLKAEAVARFLIRIFLVANIFLSIGMAVVHFSALSVLFVMFATFARCFLIGYFKKPMSTPLRSILTLHVELSYAPAFLIMQLVEPVALNYEGVSASFVFGQACVIVLALAFLVQKICWSESSVFTAYTSLQWPRWSVAKGVFWLLTVFVIASLFTLLSHKLGIARMGVDRAVLPFNLAGALDWPRKLFFPALFLFGMSFFYAKQNMRGVLFAGILFFVWVLLESYVTFSKSKFLAGFILPVLLFTCYTRIIKRWMLVSGVGIVITVALFATELNVFRQIFNSYLSDGDVSLVYESRVADIQALDRVDYLMNRVFRDGRRFSVFYDYSDGEFFINRIPIVLRLGGAIRYITIYVSLVDNSALGRHAEGASAVPEGYLVGGVPMAMMTLVFLSFLFGVIDDRRFFWPLAYPGIQTWCALFAYGLLIAGLWQWLAGGLLVALVAPLTLLFLMFLLEKKSVHKTAL